MATLGVLNKNSGQDTRIYGLHDNLFRRRLDLQREEGGATFTFPTGEGGGTRNALLWHPEPKDLPYAGKKHFGKYNQHARLGYQEKTTLRSRDATPVPENRVSHRYDHLKWSSVFPFDDVKQKHTPVDKRNGLGVASPGDKSYTSPEQSPGYFTRKVASAPPATSVQKTGALPAGYLRWNTRHTLQDIQDVCDTEEWQPAAPLEPLTVVVE